MPNIQICWHTITLARPDAQTKWRQWPILDAKKIFQGLRSMHSDKWETHRLLWKECFFYCRYRLSSLEFASQKLDRCQLTRIRCSHVWWFDRGFQCNEVVSIALYRLGHPGWNASIMMITKPVIWDTLWVGKSGTSPKWDHCCDMAKSIEYSFLHSTIVRPMCEFVESYCVRMLRE